MAAHHYQARPASSASAASSSSSSSSTAHHPQLHLPLSHHGLPRAPTSPEGSYSTRSQRYEPLSKETPASTSTSRLPSSTLRDRASSTSFAPIHTPSHQRHSSGHSYATSSDDDEIDDYDFEDDYERDPSHFFRLSIATSDANAPPSPPMTPFSPGAFPGAKQDRDDDAAQCCPHCRCSLPAQLTAVAAAPPNKQLGALQTTSLSGGGAVQRARSMDEIPSPVRRMMSTRSVGGAGKRDAAKKADAARDPAVQAGIEAPTEDVPTRLRPAAAGPSFAAKFGKKIREKLATRGAEGHAGAVGGRASRKVEYEEMEEVHWTEI